MPGDRNEESAGRMAGDVPREKSRFGGNVDTAPGDCRK
jgi:hypothetical protein